MSAIGGQGQIGGGGSAMVRPTSVSNPLTTMGE